ncbi:type II toxin-antitoxin system VapB family antitoxin [Gaiella sp.]|jgi:Arc/MetJ family transcription regulator|uniref:type II toxin-antitoxin system VapB family antitoxin n=1 Tax=Gaiella sp. TaxID=2663207 RepID=UPI002E33A3B7|nr:type II toxin-antitoxin system VapB family antitoxin [Gaiella sp.]HEX5582629.1 type II toxin-antitoxin system VapB family antitoxin [Gaiella sp.]
MKRRTTIEIDDALLAGAKAALGGGTTRATVEEALRRAADQVAGERERLAAAQSAYLDRLSSLSDLDVLRSDEMWR